MRLGQLVERAQVLRGGRRELGLGFELLQTLLALLALGNPMLELLGPQIRRVRRLESRVAALLEKRGVRRALVLLVELGARVTVCGVCGCELGR